MSFHYGGKAKDGLNWYAYCGNNPVMYVDPSGWERVNVGYFTLATLTNVEDKSTGVYASLRSISENTFGSSLTWESRGDGGVATYTLENHIIEIYFDHMVDGEYASDVKVYATYDKTWK